MEEKKLELQKWMGEKQLEPQKWMDEKQLEPQNWMDEKQLEQQKRMGQLQLDRQKERLQIQKQKEIRQQNLEEILLQTQEQRNLLEPTSGGQISERESSFTQNTVWGAIDNFTYSPEKDIYFRLLFYKIRGFICQRLRKLDRQ